MVFVCPVSVQFMKPICLLRTASNNSETALQFEGFGQFWPATNLYSAVTAFQTEFNKALENLKRVGCFGKIELNFVLQESVWKLFQRRQTSGAGSDSYYLCSHVLHSNTTRVLATRVTDCVTVTGRVLEQYYKYCKYCKRTYEKKDKQLHGRLHEQPATPSNFRKEIQCHSVIAVVQFRLRQPHVGHFANAHKDRHHRLKGR